MRRYILSSGILFICVVILSSAISVQELCPLRSAQPPTGYTGATRGVYCTSCHSTNQLNNAGGGVVVTGLPQGNYSAGMQYDFSITTTHSAADRKKWGFSIVARNSLNQTVGTFSTINPNAGLNGSELSHLNAIATGAQSSYSYTDLRWTAPSSPGVNDSSITFYYVANAANGNFNNDGDYIYAGKLTATYKQVYTFTGNGNWDVDANWANSKIPPSTLTGNAEIIIDPVTDGECVLNVEQHISNNTKFTINNGKNFRIEGGLIINNL